MMSSTTSNSIKAVLILKLLLYTKDDTSFSTPVQRNVFYHTFSPSMPVFKPESKFSTMVHRSVTDKNNLDDTKPSIIASPLEPTETFLNVENSDEDDTTKSEMEESKAATNTINERLLAELQQQQDTIQNGPKSALGKKLGTAFLRPQKTEEERQAAIEEARNLNGVNPVVAISASFAALGIAYGLWIFTSFLGELFLSHPLETDVYAVQRLASVFRNVVMGLFSLMSGFFGVTGLGVFLLGVRVAYGVLIGELDPTPIKKPKRGKEEAKLNLPEVWDFMTGKKPGRRR